MACLDLQYLTGRQSEIDVVSPGMDEYSARPRQFLKYKTFAAEQSRTELSNHCNIECNRALSEQKTVALDHDRLAGRKVEHLDLARKMTCEAEFACCRITPLFNTSRIACGVFCFNRRVDAALIPS